MICKSVKHTPLIYTREGNIATLSCDLRIIEETDQGVITCTVKKGFKWNGATGGIVKRFSETNELYNVVVLFHDVCYTFGSGICKVDADDLLRGGLRECGYGRVMAGVIHRAVTWFGSLVFGTDEYDNFKNGLFEVHFQSL